MKNTLRFGYDRSSHLQSNAFAVCRRRYDFMCRRSSDGSRILSFRFLTSRRFLFSAITIKRLILPFGRRGAVGKKGERARTRGGIPGFRVIRDKALSFIDPATGKMTPLLIAGVSGSRKYNNGLNQYSEGE